MQSPKRWRMGVGCTKAHQDEDNMTRTDNELLSFIDALRTRCSVRAFHDLQAAEY